MRTYTLAYLCLYIHIHIRKYTNKFIRTPMRPGQAKPGLGSRVQTRQIGSRGHSRGSARAHPHYDGTIACSTEVLVHTYDEAQRASAGAVRTERRRGGGRELGGGGLPPVAQGEDEHAASVPRAKSARRLAPVGRAPAQWREIRAARPSVRACAIDRVRACAKVHRCVRACAHVCFGPRRQPRSACVRGRAVASERASECVCLGVCARRAGKPGYHAPHPRDG